MVRVALLIVALGLTACGRAEDHLLVTSNGRLTPLEVNTGNANAFVEQMRRDLPVGTSVSAIEDYLSRSNLQHSRLLKEPPDSPLQSEYHVWIDDIGSVTFAPGLSSPVRLEIEIYVDENDSLDHVAARQVPTNAL